MVKHAHWLSQSITNMNRPRVTDSKLSLDALRLLLPERLINIAQMVLAILLANAIATSIRRDIAPIISSLRISVCPALDAGVAPYPLQPPAPSGTILACRCPVIEAA
jgi:hypothetical protein